MLEHLMGVHKVEGAAAEIEFVHIPDTELDIRDVSWTVAGRLADNRLRAVDPHHPAGGHTAGEIHRERAGAAAYVEQRGARRKA
jgi:hypothetical protein